MHELGRKDDIYTGTRCLAGGIVMGRIRSELTRFDRALEDQSEFDWSPAYKVSRAARPAHDAAVKLERLFPKARAEVKALVAALEPHKDYSTSYGFNRLKAAEGVAEAKRILANVAQIVAKDCGRRRPEEGEGAALVEMRRIKRDRPPKVAVEIMDVPALPIETPATRGTAIGVLAGVLCLIGLTFVVGRL